jgi:hypothetical protein
MIAELSALVFEVYDLYVKELFENGQLVGMRYKPQQNIVSLFRQFTDEFVGSDNIINDIETSICKVTFTQELYLRLVRSKNNNKFGIDLLPE